MFFVLSFSAPPDIYTLSLHDALPILPRQYWPFAYWQHLYLWPGKTGTTMTGLAVIPLRSEEHTSELQSRENLVCRLLLEKKKTGGSLLCMVTRFTPRTRC